MVADGGDWALLRHGIGTVGNPASFDPVDGHGIEWSALRIILHISKSQPIFWFFHILLEFMQAFAGTTLKRQGVAVPKGPSRLPRMSVVNTKASDYPFLWVSTANCRALFRT
ncbi:hypothetical protein HGRIS_001956 [Hohenbuehelia grisea]|uniref:Uncharacterized protein n=1 Tax=Hohenbuehelia grisea TaxID=104357 RepID=A0ABR3JJS7_9AGAR